MDYSKVDAALAAVLSEPTVGNDPSLVVSVRTRAPLDPMQQAELRNFGVQGVESDRTIFSATVSPHTVIQLTEKPWIRQLSLARRLTPLS
jgi:hypothetical protein